MYDWRKMPPEEREAALKDRQGRYLPWHNPPHRDSGEGSYHLTAACYEHQPVIGKTPVRLGECESQLLKTISLVSKSIHAWCILPNHYHLVVETQEIGTVLKAVGRFHGRTSFLWNGEDGTRGRKVWHCCVDRAIRSERHLWATVNYVHNNPVHHRYAKRWQDWPFSSAGEFLERVGREEAARLWKAYPVLAYGKGWDDPEL